MMSGRGVGRSVALALVACAGLSTGAFAQTCGSGAFNGLAAGIDGGLVRSRGDSFFSPPTLNFPTSSAFTVQDRTYGALIGVHAGYNLQCGAFVVGIEGDWASTSLKSDGTTNDPFVAPGFNNNQLTYTSSLRNLATVRARLGAEVAPNWLLYGTGGLAYGRVQHSVSFRFGGIGLPDRVTSSELATNSGWTYGGGVEHALGNWRLRAEVLAVKLDDTVLNFRVPLIFGAATTQTARWENSFLVLRVGATIRLTP